MPVLNLTSSTKTLQNQMSAGPTLQAPVDRRHTSSPCHSFNSLRILLVDDNQINLSVLSTLLKRRFGHMLACTPVCLDSGLKALQLLRTEVFDLIFMDIDMPYLDGVECTRRIRSGADGVLDANRDVHIVAVTTNTDAEPEALYRQVGMDGLIGKPARFDQFQEYLCPLAFEAHQAKTEIGPVRVGDTHLMPPMPPVGLARRLFFKPSSASPQTSSPTMSPQDTHQQGFAEMLKAQTNESLRNRRKRAMARSGTISEVRRSSFNDQHLQARQEALQTSNASPKEPVNDVSFQALIEREALASGRLSGATSPFARPQVVHRLSSPAYLLDASPLPTCMSNEEASRSTPNLIEPVPRSAHRPSIHPLARLSEAHSGGGRRDSRESPGSSEWSNESQYRLFSGLSRLQSGDDMSSTSTLNTPLSSPLGPGPSFGECGFEELDPFKALSLDVEGSGYKPNWSGSSQSEVASPVSMLPPPAESRPSLTRT